MKITPISKYLIKDLIQQEACQIALEIVIIIVIDQKSDAMTNPRKSFTFGKLVIDANFELEIKTNMKLHCKQ